MALWISLSKVTAKYLFSQVFDGSPLAVICSLFDFISDCLQPALSPKSIHALKQKGQELAGRIADWFPQTEKSLVLHILVFHIPSCLEMWGPARGTWVFAFERLVPHDKAVTICHLLSLFVTNCHVLRWCL